MRAAQGTPTRVRNSSTSSGGGLGSFDLSRTSGGSGDVPAATTSSSGSSGKVPWLAGRFFSCFGHPQPSHFPQPSFSSDPGRSPNVMLSGSSHENKYSRSPLHSPLHSDMKWSVRGQYSSGLKTLSEREPGSIEFTINDILKATKNFSPNLKIGQGGSGMVFRGQLADGTVVAVKRAKKTVYDQHTNVEFQNEIDTLRNIEHRNLVKYYGYLDYHGEKIIVVEYVNNGNLREHLDCLNGKVLDFLSRLDISIDVAHAITYLHTYADQPIIHRDIKSGNILLTDKLQAKVADFGFARLAPTDSGVTHVSTQVKGTAGYLDPEYLRTYQLTEKSDVYSFGVLLVELITGRRPIETRKPISERVTTKWAMEKYVRGSAQLTLDPNVPHKEAVILAVGKIYELAMACLAPTRNHRPSMKECVEVLWNIRKDYKDSSPQRAFP